MTETPAAGYSSRKVCALTGASYRQVESWTRQGLIRASVQEGFQSGHRRLYSLPDVFQVAVIREVATAVFHVPDGPIPTGGVWWYSRPHGWSASRVGLASLRVDVEGVRLDVVARAARDEITPTTPFQDRRPRYASPGPILCAVCHLPLADHVTGVYCRLKNQVRAS